MQKNYSRQGLYPEFNDDMDYIYKQEDYEYSRAERNWCKSVCTRALDVYHELDNSKDDCEELFSRLKSIVLCLMTNNVDLVRSVIFHFVKVKSDEFLDILEMEEIGCYEDIDLNMESGKLNNNTVDGTYSGNPLEDFPQSYLDLDDEVPTRYLFYKNLYKGYFNSFFREFCRPFVWFWTKIKNVYFYTTYIWIFFGLFGWSASSQIKVRLSSMCKEWKVLLDDPNSPASKDKKILMVEIKAVVHTIYYAYLGKTTEALSHASYLFLTRVDLALAFISIFTQARSTKQNKTFQDWKVGNVTYYLPDREYVRYMENFEKYGTVATPPDIYLKKPFRTETPEVINMVAALFGALKLTGMDDKELRRANYGFSYIYNLKKTSVEVTNFMLAAVSCICRHFDFDPFDVNYQKYQKEVIHMIDETNSFIKMTPMQLTNLETIDRILLAYEQGKDLMFKNPAIRSGTGSRKTSRFSLEVAGA